MVKVVTQRCNGCGHSVAVTVHNNKLYVTDRRDQWYVLSYGNFSTRSAMDTGRSFRFCPNCDVAKVFVLLDPFSAQELKAALGCTVPAKVDPAVQEVLSAAVVRLEWMALARGPRVEVAVYDAPTGLWLGGSL